MARRLMLLALLAWALAATAAALYYRGQSRQRQTVIDDQRLELELRRKGG